MKFNDNTRLIESILFLENQPLSLDKIVELSSLSKTETIKSLEALSDEFSNSNHGFTLVSSEDTYQFVLCNDMLDSIKKSYENKADVKLSKSAIETIAIVAYQQPVTKAEISKIRGVNTDSIVRMLKEKEYIKIVGKKEINGHPFLYGTTDKFLKSFNLKSVNELPKLSELEIL